MDLLLVLSPFIDRLLIDIKRLVNYLTEVQLNFFLLSRRPSKFFSLILYWFPDCCWCWALSITLKMIIINLSHGGHFDISKNSPDCWLRSCLCKENFNLLKVNHYLPLKAKRKRLEIKRFFWSIDYRCLESSFQTTTKEKAKVLLTLFALSLHIISSTWPPYGNIYENLNRSW